MSDAMALPPGDLFRQAVADARTTIRLTVAVLLRNREGHLLLEKRRDCGLWGMPGGRVEPGESISDAAVREVFEETGFTIRVIGLRGVYSEPAGRIVSYPDNVVQIVDVLVEAVIVTGTLRLSDESEQMTFFAPDVLPPDAELIPPARRIVRDILAGAIGVLA
jgi:8-oxo-dGTP pyrophosphatase MutT (NUDIX family)